jgi:hypothetical protein
MFQINTVNLNDVHSDQVPTVREITCLEKSDNILFVSSRTNRNQNYIRRTYNVDPEYQL